MMYCTNCGNEVLEGSVFCENCGEKMFNPTIVTEPVSTQNAYIAALKKAGSSKFMLVSAILFSASILVSFIASLFVNSSQTISELYEVFGLYSTDYSNLAAGASSSVAFSVTVNILPILTVCGMWMFYAASANKTATKFSTSGLTMIKVINIIYIVFISIAAFFLELMFIVMAVLSANVDNILSSLFGYEATFSETSGITGPMLVVIFVTCIILMAAIFAVAIIYQALIIKTVNAVKSVAITGQPTNKISMTLVVFNFIFAGFSAISGLYSLVLSFLIPGFTMTAINSLIGAAVLIVISIGIIKVRPILMGMTAEIN